MKKILILEDNPDRILLFRELFSGIHELVITDEVSEAIRFLRTTDFSWIFLDHDLKETHYTSGAPGYTATGIEETGQDVARWLAYHPENNPAASIIIHSLNRSGRELMKQLLIDGGRDPQIVPFNTLSILLLLRNQN